MEYTCGNNSEIQEFGTTAVVVVVHIEDNSVANLIVANTGDSLAFLGKDTGSGLIGEDITVVHGSLVSPI